MYSIELTFGNHFQDNCVLKWYENADYISEQLYEIRFMSNSSYQRQAECIYDIYISHHMYIISAGRIIHHVWSVEVKSSQPNSSLINRRPVTLKTTPNCTGSSPITPTPSFATLLSEIVAWYIANMSLFAGQNKHLGEKIQRVSCLIRFLAKLESNIQYSGSWFCGTRWPLRWSCCLYSGWS